MMNLAVRSMCRSSLLALLTRTGTTFSKSVEEFSMPPTSLPCSSISNPIRQAHDPPIGSEASRAMVRVHSQIPVSLFKRGKNRPPQQLSFSRDCSHQQCNGDEDGFLCLFLCFRGKKDRRGFSFKKLSRKKFVTKRRNHKQAKMDYKQISGQKWDREVVCRSRLLARAAAVGTREGDEEDERWRETWEEVAVSHPLGNSMTELSSSLSLALDNSWQKLSSSLSTSRSHSIALPREFRAELSSSVSGSRSVSSNRQFLAELSSALSGSRSLVFSFDNYWQNCHLLSLAHALAIALSLRSLWSVLDCTRFLFSRSQAFFSLFLFWHIYRYMRIPSFPCFGLCRILCVLWVRVSLFLVFAKQEVVYLKSSETPVLSSTRGGRSLHEIGVAWELVEKLSTHNSWVANP